MTTATVVTFADNHVRYVLAMLKRNNEDEIRRLAASFGPALLNGKVRRPDCSMYVRRTSPLLYALELSLDWKLLLDLGADPMLPVDEDSSPFLKAVELQNLEFLKAIRFDPLREYQGNWYMHLFLSSLTRAMPVYRQNSCRMRSRYVPVDHIFEEGWYEGALVALDAIASRPEDRSSFDANRAWSGSFPESAGDTCINCWQTSEATISFEYRGPHAPQTILFRACFHAMTDAVPKLIELGADPLRRNQSGQTHLHALLFGAIEMTSSAARSCRPDIISAEVVSRFASTCDALLEAGVDPRIEDIGGRLPLTMALSSSGLSPSLAEAIAPRIRRIARVRTTVEMLSRAFRAGTSPMLSGIGTDAIHCIFAALHPNYKRICNIPDWQSPVV